MSMEIETTTKKRKQSGPERDKARLKEIMGRMKSWSDLSEPVKGHLPAGVVAAVMSGRAELLDLAVAAAEASPPEEAVQKEQYLTMLQLVKVLMETNFALQEHAQELAKRTVILSDSVKGLLGAARRIDDFANFRDPTEEEE
jgi:hypothetical protein